MAKRINKHPILGERKPKEEVEIVFNGKKIKAEKGEMIAAALQANGIRIHRYTIKNKEPRGVFCGIGQCTDCAMEVNGRPNVRTCVTPVQDGMIVNTQYGLNRNGDNID